MIVTEITQNKDKSFSTSIVRKNLTLEEMTKNLHDNIINGEVPHLEPTVELSYSGKVYMVTPSKLENEMNLLKDYARINKQKPTWAKSAKAAIRRKLLFKQVLPMSKIALFKRMIKELLLDKSRNELVLSC